MAGGETNSNKGLNGMMTMLSQNPTIKIQSKIKELESGFQFKIKELENGLQFRIKELENGLQFKIKELENVLQFKIKEGFLNWVPKLDVFVFEAVVASILGARGGFIIGSLVSLGNMIAKKPTPSLFRFPEQLFSGGPIVQARNFAASSAVNITIMGMLEGSNTKYALKSVMIAGLGAGAMFSLVNGMGGRGTISIKNMLETGVFFALVNGGVHMYKKDYYEKRLKDSPYVKRRRMLMNMTFEEYRLNIKKERSKYSS